VNTTAVNTIITESNTMALSVTMALSTTLLCIDTIAITTSANETVTNSCLYTEPKPTAHPTTAATADATTIKVNNAGNTTSIDIATDTPLPNNSAPDTSSFTYSHEEVQQLLEDARLDGWEEGYKEGSKKLMEGYRDGYEA
jgi:hypothetical protein